MTETRILNNTLEYTEAVAARTASIYQRVERFIPRMEWMVHAPYIDAINRLKHERNAIILAHNYQTPEIFHGVADIVGDSLALAREAGTSNADTIVLCGVHFMAETAKLLNPNRRVLIPDTDAGCSLAASITGKDVKLLKQRYPGVPIVAYVNTSADVKAEVDICCTSSNALAVVESLNSDRVIMLPDEYLAQNVAAETDVEIIIWKGRCEVHERFSARDISDFRAGNPGVTVLAHPECPPEVVAVSDFTGSTAGMIDFVGREHPSSVVLVTECSMSDNVAVQYPEINFVRPCNLCPHMKRITLPKILKALETLTPEVEIDMGLADNARLSVERMLALSTGDKESHYLHH